MADVVGSLGNENPGRPLRLVREGVEGSIRRGIDVNFMTGRFSIRFSGDYHVYSHVVFKGDERSQVDTRIVKLTVEYVYCSLNMHFSSVQVVSMRSEKPISAPLCLSDVSPTFPLERFQCWSD